MSTPQATLRNRDRATVYPIGNGSVHVYVEVDFRHSESRTSLSQTVNVPESAITEYQSILPFEGMFAQSDFWDDMPEFLNAYWQEPDIENETE